VYFPCFTHNKLQVTHNVAFQRHVKHNTKHSLCTYKRFRSSFGHGLDVVTHNAHPPHPTQDLHQQVTPVIGSTSSYLHQGQDLQAASYTGDRIYGVQQIFAWALKSRVDLAAATICCLLWIYWAVLVGELGYNRDRIYAQLVTSGIRSTGSLLHRG